MQASQCKFLLDFNPKYDRARTQWERERAEALRLEGPGRVRRVNEVDERNGKICGPILQKDIQAGIVRCKADSDVSLGETLSLDDIAQTFGITRPRVQQIEARAKEKMLLARRDLLSLSGQAPEE